MNFNQMMNWILGRPSPELPTASLPQQEERRISPRLNYADGVVQVLGVGDFPLVDLAQGGLSLNTRDHPILANPQSGMLLPAKICLGSVFFETDLRVCSLRHNEIGCAFGSMPAGHSRVLNDFLKPRTLGTSIREIRATEANLRWFQGNEETQIYFWSKPEGGLDKADFYFMDYLISFDGKDNSLKTGFVRTPFWSGGGRGLPEEGTIAYHETPSYRALKLGHIIFEHASLPEDIYLNLASIMYREEKCTFSRVILGEKDRNITFEFSDESGPVVLRVASLCSTAISALLPDATVKRKIPQGTLLNGALRLPDRVISATFKVVFQHDFLLGGGLKLQNPEDAECFASFLTPRILGKSLESIAAPAETKPFAPHGSWTSLYVGIHNTHLLSLVMRFDSSLLYGRLVFSDRVILWDKSALSAFSCPQGIIFPSDWDIVTSNREKITHDDPALLTTIREILQSARISQEVRNAWEGILPSSPD
ncbi:MAG: hypothetical protein CVV41_09795 [Candidatus Riflebacteria bacterium HGW-Riflebacteria-1]|jgi:hypothetical protein|nr:MAG: hypothetical protein CVV41_09795 [Candidatus Riflebacteria bacterium HGW-Riflebacteria-1]